MKKIIVVLIILIALVFGFLTYRTLIAKEPSAFPAETETQAEPVTEEIPETETETEKTSKETEPGPETYAEDETEQEIPEIWNLPAGSVLTEEEVALLGAENCFYSEPISDQVFARMDGLTFKDYSPVTREELRYIRCLYKDIDGVTRIGELVMHESVADELCEIFYELYLASYPIEKMVLADDYGAEDLVSAADNNTSGYNTRFVEFTDILCRHAYGMAIDINPLYNIYYITDEDLALPEEGYVFKDRETEYPYKINPGDLCCQLFEERGWVWGGQWYDPDYMHFEK